jgi:hypothetical protein
MRSPCSVSECVSHRVVANQRFGKNVPTATNHTQQKKIFGRVLFHTVRIVAKESILVVLHNTSRNLFDLQLI